MATGGKKAEAARVPANRLSRLVIMRFSFKQVRRGAIILGVLFGIAAISQTTGLVKAYPTPEARSELVTSLKTNVGLQIMFGSSEHLDNTVRSYANWRVLGIITVIGSIWGILATTRLLRGEEEDNRWELLLSSPINARQATRQTVTGILNSVLLIIVLTGLALTVAGNAPDVAIGPGAALLFGLTMISGGVMFIAVAALASQLASTRSRAAMIASALLGLSFLVRAIANTSESAHWLRNINPLSWVDNILPLTEQRLEWFLPIFSFAAAVMSLAFFLSGRRDLLAGFIPQRDSATARLALLGNPFRFALRLTRGPILSWMIAITLPSIVFGVLAVTASGILDASGTLTEVISKTLGQPSAGTGEKIFLGMGFMLIAIFAMAMAAAAVQGIRSEEARETLDNILVRPVRRLQWLGGRVVIAAVWVTTACLWAGVACWTVAQTQQSALGFSVFITAGVNIIAPAVCIMGIGVAVFGLRPRLTASAMYVIIGWSFLVEILGSLLNAPAWVLNTSILHHVAAAPIVNPDWNSAAILVGLGLILSLIGALAFNRRDLQNE